MYIVRQALQHYKQRHGTDAAGTLLINKRTIQKLQTHRRMREACSNMLHQPYIIQNRTTHNSTTQVQTARDRHRMRASRHLAHRQANRTRTSTAYKNMSNPRTLHSNHTQYGPGQNRTQVKHEACLPVVIREHDNTGKTALRKPLRTSMIQNGLKGGPLRRYPLTVPEPMTSYHTWSDIC